MSKIVTSCGILKYKPQIIYVGIKQINKSVALENLKIVANVMNKSGLKWGPTLGTLLGIIRDNDFITWDEDIDLYIMEEDQERFLPMLFEFQKKGFDVIRFCRSGVLSIKRKGEYIDFYFMKNLGNGIRCAVGEVYLFEDYLTDTIQWDFKGCSLNVPRKYEEFLEFHYGDWRTPIKYADYEMTALRKMKTIISLYVKNHIPDFLFYPLFRQHHQPSLDRFKKKCESKGINIGNEVSLSAYKK